MAVEYSIETCNRLKELFVSKGLHRPMRTDRFDPGTELSYDVTGVFPANEGKVRLNVEKFIGGGFAGQVYQVRITYTESDGPLAGLEVGGIYAMKILIPPSRRALVFRNVLYGIGFQGPFQLQTNPTATRSGALWQKFIRRAARVKFGNESAVNDIHATFVDHQLGSCGELSDWVEGRTWRLEVDDHLDALKLWRKKKAVNEKFLNSPEFRAKHKFMHDFVKLLHEIGAHEFARQYEWSTCKSQPNCLKLKETEGDPVAGLVAVDFRAGLTLLPFLPMSPGDFKLIGNGIKRGSLVQFDRGNIKKLERFMGEHREDFLDMSDMLDELKADERIYRDSLIDITHNHVRLLYDRKLWSTILDSAVTGWRLRNLLDDDSAEKLRTRKVSTIIFAIGGLIPFLGRALRKTWGRADWRKHYKKLLTNNEYFGHAVKARIIEKTIGWHRAGRVTAEKAETIASSTLHFMYHFPLSILPVGLHRFLSDSQFMKEKLFFIFVRPVKLYFNQQMREQWLRDMIRDGQKKHILMDDDARTILSQIDEPYIQKYLVSLVVHLLTLPVTQVVSVMVSWIYVRNHPELTSGEATVAVVAILGLFQVTPISPGSICRGLYTTCLAIHDRNFKDYNIALFLSYFKYVGYLAFPIQMAHHYPALSRFMAGHWATEATHIVPVFGERGALLEHWVFSLFYNLPLTLRRRMRKRAELRATLAPRYWHAGLCAIAMATVFGMFDHLQLQEIMQANEVNGLWWLSFVMPLAMGAFVTLWCGGATLGKRIISACLCGLSGSLIYTCITVFQVYGSEILPKPIIVAAVWRLFVFAIFATIGAIVTELKLPDPDLRLDA